MEFRILFFGDIVGEPGRFGIASALPRLRDEHHPDLVIANVENSSHGRGTTPNVLEELDALGIDAYTSGNHIWENAKGLDCFSDDRWKNRLVRPANAHPDRQGKGFQIIEKQGVRVLVVNVLGQLFMKETQSSPFLTIDRILETAPTHDLCLIDIHAEATSEKEAFGHYVDGRVQIVVGTHTHVPTADAKILTKGTAYMTDAGRNGAHDSVVGFEKTSAIQRFIDPSTKTYDPAKNGPIDVNCVLIRLDTDTKTALGIQHIHKIVDR